MRVALLGGHARAGDAIGQQLAEKTAFFLDHGADVRVFLEDQRDLEPTLKGRCRPWPPGGKDRHFLDSADLILVDYSQHHPLHDALPELAEGTARIVLDYHGVTPPELWPEHRDELERSTQQRALAWFADAALVHSRFAGQELRAASQYPVERCFTVGYPIDTAWFAGGPSSLWRQRLGLDEDALLLLFVGRVAPSKDLPTLVEALAQLRDHAPAIHALVIGDTTDRYQVEAERCRAMAELWGVADRLHLVGKVDAVGLRDAYRSADLFVTPSRHEAFCIPVVEAQAAGLPVLAARAGALAETVGDGGLTFQPGDPDDLARQVRRVLRADCGTCSAEVGTKRVAVVSGRFGSDFVGGAETVLRTLAETLSGAGNHVEVFTIGAETGCVQFQGMPVRRFPADEVDQDRFACAQARIANGDASDETEQDFLANSVHSRELMDALGQRIAEFDAVLVGPYLLGLSQDVARAFPEKTLLLPCMHDEPAARLGVFRWAYSQVGGILYLSPEEQVLAEVELGVNHPGSVSIGAVIDLEAGDRSRGQALAGSDRKLIVYAGRYTEEKNLPLLLEYAAQYAGEHPERFQFVFLGEGNVPIPADNWARDLGFVDANSRRDVMAAATALVQLSRRESLSLVALEAWAQGVPVLADAGCAVLAGHLERNGAGQLCTDYAGFAAALDDLWQQPDAWHERGARGRAYVQQAHGDRQRLAETLVDAIQGLTVPLSERMKRRGQARAASWQRDRWRREFGQVIEQILDLPRAPHTEELVVEPRQGVRSVSAGMGSLLVPVRIANRGDRPALMDGPAAVILRSRLMDGDGKTHAGFTIETPLPTVVLPGQSQPAAVEVAVPDAPGHYRLGLRAERSEQPLSAETWIELTVEARGQSARPSRSLVELALAALAPAGRLQQLPDTYHDVSEGFLAGLKRRLKHKLLNNFKRAYVDVLSRQQSAFNRQVLCAVHELAECCGVLEHASQQAKSPPTAAIHEDVVRQLHQKLADRDHRIGQLEARLAALEELLLAKEVAA